MSRSLNKVMIIGNLGRDPEMRYTPSGKPVTTFSVATNHVWVDTTGQKHSETEWFNVVCWNSLAEICKDHLSKGDRVYVEGRLQTRHWEDADGNQRTSVEIVASEMMILGDRASSSDNEQENNLDELHEFEENE
jgi:single-strand DNA-binding protein